jgi:SAM-dependent methyltransferase
MIKKILHAPFRILFPESKLTLYLDLFKKGWRPFVKPPAQQSYASVLTSKHECEQALSTLKTLGLPPHPDQPKNWDALIAVSEIVSSVDKDMAVLDAGGTLYSPILPWLFLLGYNNLQSIDLVFEKVIKRGPIRYYPGDLTSSSFADAQFSAVTCMSVIEHGVPINKYFKEMYRILKPGGYLITSTDYWEYPIDTQGAQAYGEAVTIFDKKAIKNVISSALKQGFELVEDVEFGCNEKVVHWETTGLDFTFIIFKLRKPHEA